MNVRTLNLRGTPLGNQSQAEVISIMQNIDSAITSVNLRDTSLGNKSATELIAILKALPQQLLLLT